MHILETCPQLTQNWHKHYTGLIQYDWPLAVILPSQHTFQCSFIISTSIICILTHEASITLSTKDADTKIILDWQLTWFQPYSFSLLPNTTKVFKFIHVKLFHKIEINDLQCYQTYKMIVWIHSKEVLSQVTIHYGVWPTNITSTGGTCFNDIRLSSNINKNPFHLSRN